MSTRLADLTQYREWQGYGTGYPVGFYAIPKNAFKNFAYVPLGLGRPAFWYAKNHTPNPGMGAAAPVLDGMQYDKPLLATVPSDGRTVMPGGNACQCDECVEARRDKSGPMTLSRAVAVLNEYKYLHRRWVPSDLKAEWQDGAITVPCHFDDSSVSRSGRYCNCLTCRLIMHRVTSIGLRQE